MFYFCVQGYFKVTMWWVVEHVFSCATPDKKLMLVNKKTLMFLNTREREKENNRKRKKWIFCAGKNNGDIVERKIKETPCITALWPRVYSPFSLKNHKNFVTIWQDIKKFSYGIDRRLLSVTAVDDILKFRESTEYFLPIVCPTNSGITVLSALVCYALT